jgi:hypothetical protein
MLYFAYVDEFGHVGPYVSRSHPQHRTSPVFGFAGILLPATSVREFGEFFVDFKRYLLGPEMKGRGVTDAVTWEKKGSALYTTRNYTKYRKALTRGTNRLLNRIEEFGGHTIYVGAYKDKPPLEHDSTELYRSTFELLLRRINSFAANQGAQVLVVMDEHEHRDMLLDQAARMMYHDSERLRNLLEPPYEVESHRYLTVQCADWICGLVGRFGAYRADPVEFLEFEWAEEKFAPRVDRAAILGELALGTTVESLPSLLSEETAELSPGGERPVAPDSG